MSDTSIDEELPMAEGAERPRSPLVIPVSQSVLNLQGGESSLSKKEAAQLIGGQLWNMTSPGEDKGTFWDGLFAFTAFFGRELTEDEDEQTMRERAALLSVVTDLVLQSVPEENQSATVLSAIDLRPYIAAVQANPEAALATTDAKEMAKLADFPDVYAADIWNELDKGAGDWTTFGDSLLQRYTAREITTVQAERGDTPLTEAEITQLVEVVPDAAGLNATARLGAAQTLTETGGVTTEQVGQVQTGELDPWAILGGAGEDVVDGPALTFDPAKIEEWVRSGQETFDSILGDQVSGEQEGLLAPGQNVYDFKVVSQRSMPGDSGMGNPSMRTFSAVEAVNYLTTLDDATFTKMQDRLAAAGYFARLGLRPERGYQWDDATNQAWRLALEDSVRRGGVSIPELLTQQATEWQTRAQERFKKFSIADTRFSANQIAQEVLGRNLTGDEFQVVKTFMQNLQNERRDQFASGSNLDWLGEGTNADTGFNEDDYTDAVEQAVGTKAYGDRAFDGLQKLNQALGFTSNRPNDPQRED